MEIPIWVRAGLSLIAVSNMVSCQPKDPEATPIRPTATARAASSPTPPILPDLTFKGLSLETGRKYAFGNTIISRQSFKYEVAIDPDKLNFWQKFCHASRIPRIEAGLADAIPGNKPSDILTTPSSTTAVFSLNRYYQDAESEALQTGRGVDEIVSASVTARLASWLCTESQIVPTMAAGGSADPTIAANMFPLGNQIKEDILRGSAPAIFQVRRLPNFN